LVILYKTRVSYDGLLSVFATVLPRKKIEAIPEMVALLDFRLIPAPNCRSPKLLRSPSPQIYQPSGLVERDSQMRV
jgi:hypothetical protein